MNRLNAITIMAILLAIAVVFIDVEYKQQYPFLTGLVSGLVGGIIVANFMKHVVEEPTT
jgi:hypothetical protein